MRTMFQMITLINYDENAENLRTNWRQSDWTDHYHYHQHHYHHRHNVILEAVDVGETTNRMYGRADAQSKCTENERLDIEAVFLANASGGPFAVNHRAAATSPERRCPLC